MIRLYSTLTAGNILFIIQINLIYQLSSLKSPLIIFTINLFIPNDSKHSDNHIYLLYIINKMFQIYTSRKLTHSTRFQTHIPSDKIINSDYFGNPSSERRLSNFPSRSRSLKKTQLSAEKSNTKAKKNSERQNQDKSIASRTKESTNCYQLKTTFKRSYSKDKTVHKHRTIKKLMSYPTVDNNPLKKVQRTNSNQRIQQYFEPYKLMQKQKNIKKQVIHNQLEKKAMECYNQMKSTKVLIDPGHKKKQIQEFLKKSTKNIYFASQDSTFKVQDNKPIKNTKQKQTSILVQNKHNDSLIDISNNTSELPNNCVKVQQHITNEIKQSIPKLNKETDSIQNTDSSNFLRLQSNLGRFKNRLNNKNNQIGYCSKSISKIINDNNCVNKNEIMESIEMHIEIIDSLVEFVVRTQQIYNHENDYNYECFLLYKKYFIERLKIQNSLSGNGNCFILKHIQVKSQVLTSICNTPQIIQLLKIIEEQNLEIEQSLQSNYRTQYDTDINNLCSKQFTKLIILELNKQFTKLIKQHNIITQNHQQIQQRIMRIVQITFLMEQLQRNLVKSYLQCENIKDFNMFIELNIIDYQNIIKKYA